MVSGAERNDWVPELAILKHAEGHFTPEGRPYYHNTTWVGPRSQTIIRVMVVIEVISSFLYRGRFNDYQNTFEIRIIWWHWRSMLPPAKGSIGIFPCCWYRVNLPHPLRCLSRTGRLIATFPFLGMYLSTTI